MAASHPYVVILVIRREILTWIVILIYMILKWNSPEFLRIFFINGSPEPIFGGRKFSYQTFPPFLLPSHFLVYQAFRITVILATYEGQWLLTQFLRHSGLWRWTQVICTNCGWLVLLLVKGVHKTRSNSEGGCVSGRVCEKNLRLIWYSAHKISFEELDVSMFSTKSTVLECDHCKKDFIITPAEQAQ